MVGNNNRKMSAISELALDAHDRHLVYRDEDTRDTHPSAIKQRECQNAWRIQHDKDQQDKTDLNFSATVSGEVFLGKKTHQLETP